VRWYFTMYDRNPNKNFEFWIALIEWYYKILGKNTEGALLLFLI
jgi:hypothetical protein